MIDAERDRRPVEERRAITQLLDDDAIESTEQQ